MVLSVYILISGCLLYSSENKETPNQELQNPPWESMLKAYGIISFLFDIHPSILTILVDMDDKKKTTAAIFGGFGGKKYMM